MGVGVWGLRFEFKAFGLKVGTGIKIHEIWKVCLGLERECMQGARPHTGNCSLIDSAKV